MRAVHRILISAPALLLPLASHASAQGLQGHSLGLWWALPFVCLLLAIAMVPLLLPRIWHAHDGKIAALCALAFLLPLTLLQGPGTSLAVLAHVMLSEYLPFLILITALYTTAGGIYVRGNLHGSPALNTTLMAIGALLASVMGTTGASMLMVRPLIRANDNRPSAAHVMVFFIFIVSNAAGALTPLGDPPLFLGFLQGVDFFWTLKALLPQTAFLVGVLLLLFYLLDSYRFKRDGLLASTDPTPDDGRLGLEGMINLLPLLAIMGLVLMSGAWHSGLSWTVLGVNLALESLLRDLGLLAVVFVSLWLTPQAVREKNRFSWGPMQEVARLFAGIFITMIPVMAMLKAGEQGAFASLVHLVNDASGQPRPWAYFWLSGSLSSFLDNAPTYLVFFNLAGGDAQQLMQGLAPVLAAVSAGSVYMGANSYIGNAPNFMVKAVAEARGIRMPSFVGYLGWSSVVLLPLFLIQTLIWFR